MKIMIKKAENLETNDLPNNPVVEAIGGFSGQLRRPEPRTKGYVAKIFAENGPDADHVTAMGLTKFVDMSVKVRMSGLKFHSGQSMRSSEDEPYPILGEFTCRIVRPKASLAGQTALFFAENGSDADTVAKLGLTNLLDALVHVEIYPLDIFNLPSPDEKVLEVAGKRLTPTEKKNQDSIDKKTAVLNQILVMRGFYRQESLWAALGGHTGFRAWLMTQNCAWPSSEPCTRAVEELHSLQPASRYRCVPLCTHHKNEIGKLQAHMPPEQSRAFMETRYQKLAQLWVADTLHQQLGIGPHAQLPPEKLMSWLDARGLKDLLPGDYMNQVFHS